MDGPGDAAWVLGSEVPVWTCWGCGCVYRGSPGLVLVLGGGRRYQFCCQCSGRVVYEGREVGVREGVWWEGSTSAEAEEAG